MRVLGLQRGRLKDLYAGLLGGKAQRIRAPTRLLGGTEDPRDGITPSDKRLQRGLPELLLAEVGDALSLYSR